MTDVTSGDRAISVTVKYKDDKGKGYDMPWVVFKGNPDEVRADLLAVYGLDAEATKELTLHELVVNVTAIAHARHTAATILGATSIPSSASPAEGTAFDEPAADAAPAEPEVNPLFAEIEAAASVDDLKRLWADNQSAFADAELMAAWKARGKAIQAAA